MEKEREGRCARGIEKGGEREKATQGEGEGEIGEEREGEGGRERVRQGIRGWDIDREIDREWFNIRVRERHSKIHRERDWATLWERGSRSERE